MLTNLSRSSTADVPEVRERTEYVPLAQGFYHLWVGILYSEHTDSGYQGQKGMVSVRARPLGYTGQSLKQQQKHLPAL